ncbi:MAG: amidohydrolase [Alphaproteobacteria bacterium]|nr:amidohydrolase [Alphaproteobacteria bacterium]
MNRHRRDFLSFTASGLALSMAGSRAAFADPQAPDLIVFNASVHTVDTGLPRAEAFAVRAGRFVAVGSNDIKSLAAKSTQLYDAKGMMVVPGFIDTHNHSGAGGAAITGNAGGEGLLYDIHVGNPYEVEQVTISSIIDKLKAKAASLPPETWVIGDFLDDTKLADKRPLNVQDLDKVSADHPVGVVHRGGHTFFVNSKAFQLAGVTKATPDPFGGTFDKDASGELNGRVTDRAMAAFAGAGKREEFTPAQRAQRALEGVAFISGMFARYGLTTVHHNEDGALEALQEQRLRGNLKHRVSYEARGELLEAMIKNGLESGFGDEWVRLGATAEHTVDGSLSERTMAISQSYIGMPASYHGNLTETQEVLNGWCERVHRAHIQLNCHANGDIAIDRTLTAYERALKLYPRADARPKITHCSMITPDLVRRMKALNVVPSLFNTYPYYNSDKFHFYGQEMMQHTIAFRTLLDAGIVASAGSDFGPGPFSPLMAIQAMVTRTGWNGETWGASQKITLDEAIKVNSWNGAYNSREEKDKGSITTGKLADFLVLAEDLHAIAPDKIKDVKIVRTVVGGKTMYQA